MTKLPDWLLAELPEIRAVEFIDFVDGKWTFRGMGYDSVVEAYDEALKLNDNVAFTETADENFPGEIVDAMYFAKEGRRLLLRYTDYDSLDYLETMYEEFISNIDTHYQDNPGDWVAAYNWIQAHPCFWVFARNKKDNWDWNTDNGIDAISQYVSREDGKAMVCMETGGHTPDYLGCYHDSRLDVCEDTFEAAYVALAKKVNQLFNTDGSEKPVAADIEASV